MALFGTARSRSEFVAVEYFGLPKKRWPRKPGPLDTITCRVIDFIPPREDRETHLRMIVQAQGEKFEQTQGGFYTRHRCIKHAGGRGLLGETALVCACREYEEEIGISLQTPLLFVCVFGGFHSKRSKHHGRHWDAYFVTVSKYPDKATGVLPDSNEVERVVEVPISAFSRNLEVFGARITPSHYFRSRIVLSRPWVQRYLMNQGIKYEELKTLLTK